MKLDDQKLMSITDLLLSFPVISKRPFYYLSIYWGTDTFDPNCRLQSGIKMITLSDSFERETSIIITMSQTL